MTDAIGIWAYRNTLLPRTAATLVKYCPPHVPIYIMDQAAPHMAVEKTQMRDIAASHPGRIVVTECFVSEKRGQAPGSILRFLDQHPEIDRLLKIDDDFIVCCDLYSGLVAAYESHPETFFSAGLCPINNWGVQVLDERLGWGDKIDRCLLDSKYMFRHVLDDPSRAKRLWELTTPPADVLPRLRREPRFVAVPHFKAHFGMSHYFAHRDDIYAAGGQWDEKTWYRRWCGPCNHRPRLIDTWSLVYHFAWFYWFDYAMREIMPIIERTEF